MTDDGGKGRGRRRSLGSAKVNEAKAADETDEADDLETYVDLAREIRREVTRLAADDAAGAEAIEASLDRFPVEAREQLARSVFDRLAPDTQWDVIERVFDDREIRRYLEAEREARLALVRRREAHHLLLLDARAEGVLDTRLLPAGLLLTIGLFREADVAAAVRRGARSSGCVRRVVVRSEGGGTGAQRVVEDVFDPDRAYFVTSEYDERTWRSERLASHARVWVGSLDSDDPTAAEGGSGFTPMLVPGARVDVRSEVGTSRGRLHLGFAMLAEDDVFAG